MLSPLSWIKEYVALPPPPKLIDRLNQTGTTVAAVRQFGEGLDNIIVGEIQEVVPHPNADKLQLAKVKVPGKLLSIVCGAKNIEAGQKVPVAGVGTFVPIGPNGQPMKIERIKIRDVESQGMLCSGKELGLGSDYAGILILNPDLKIGTKLTAALNLPEIVLETEVTTNRGDELSIYGLAREISAVTGGSLKTLTAKAVTPADSHALSVKIEDPKLCPRYCAVTISNLKVGPSPDFIQMRLLESGMRPINNVVDITNYIMLLTGQPLHAFDYAKVAEGGIIVRESRAGERVTTLDGVTRVLGFGSIVIADSEKVLGLGGVMGGEGSGVSELTDTIVLESAVFDPVSIRQTAIKFNLRSEASLRFERSVDAQGSDLALELAVELFQKYAAGRVSSGVVDIFPNPYKPSEVSLTKAKLEQYLGYKLPLSSAAIILTKLGFNVVKRSSNSITIEVPSWRAHDASIEEDLIEEVARLEGYDKIPSCLPAGLIPESKPHSELKQIYTIKDHLASLGLSEVMNYSMISEEHLGTSNALRLTNYISSDWEYMRTLLLFGLLKSSFKNYELSGNFRVFEVGKVYKNSENGDLPHEINSLAFVGENFSEVKGYFESIISKLNIHPATYEQPSSEEKSFWIDYARVSIEGERIGQIGSPSLFQATRLGVKKTLYFGEFNLEKLLKHTNKNIMYIDVPRFPSIYEDVSFVVDLDLPVQEVVQEISELANVKHLTNIHPLEPGFTKKEMGLNKKSMLLRLTFQSTTKTLTNDEVRVERVKVENLLKSKFKAKIR